MASNCNLVIKNISKSYKSRKVVQNVSLDLNQGEIIGLLGPNGAGKTTCFYIILGLINSDSGEIILNKQNITKKPIHIRSKLGIGYLPQEPSIFRKLTVEHNILAILQLNKKSTKLEKQDQLDKLITEFQLENVRHSFGFSLSGGERRRLEIARVLAVKPKFILLDEPFAGVDPISINNIKQIIKYLAKKNIGIIITDHNVRETLSICNKAYIINNGQVISQGSPETILKNQQVRKVYLGENFEI